MQAAAVEVNQGTYTASSKLTVGQWLDIWQRDYLGSLKPCTVRTYKTAISISKQLSRLEHRDGGLFVSPKSGKGRTITAAPVVLRALQTQKRRQAEMQLKAGQIWDNPHELVFTNEAGAPLEQRAVDYQFKRIVADAGLEGVCFHDTRHTYAVNAIRAGDDIKTVQANLGHATAAFTLDRYAHFTETMQKDSADRMEGFVKAVLNL